MAYGQDPQGQQGQSQGQYQGYTSGADAGDGTGASVGASRTSGVDWQRFANQLPEEYRSNPTEFLSAYNQAKQYKDWYQQQYEPWHKSFDAKSYQEFLQSRQQGQGDDIDWDNTYEAPRVAYQRSMQKVQALEQALEERTKQFIDLLQLVQQVEDLRRQELYDHLGRHGFQPQMDPAQILTFAMEHGVSDLKMAADQWRQQQTKARAAATPARQFRDRQPSSRKELNAIIAKQHPGIAW